MGEGTRMVEGFWITLWDVRSGNFVDNYELFLRLKDKGKRIIEKETKNWSILIRLIF